MWKLSLDTMQKSGSMPVPFMTGTPFNFWAVLCGGLLARSNARALAEFATAPSRCTPSSTAAFGRALNEHTDTHPLDSPPPARGSLHNERGGNRATA